MKVALKTMGFASIYTLAASRHHFNHKRHDNSWAPRLFQAIFYILPCFISFCIIINPMKEILSIISIFRMKKN